MKINYLQEILDNRKSHFWYSGDVVEIIYSENIKFIISAVGDVIGNLYKDGECIKSFKDKYNRGAFLEEAQNYIKDDDELSQYATFNIVDDSYIDYCKNDKYIIQFDNNNWWEVFAFVDNEYVDMMHCLDSSILEEAIEETISQIPMFIDYLKDSNIIK